MSIYEIIPALDLTQSVHDIYKCMHWGMGGQILNLQNISDRDCDEIRLEIQSRNILWMSNLSEITRTLQKQGTNSCAPEG